MAALRCSVSDAPASTADRWLTPTQAAVASGLSERTVRRQLAASAETTASGRREQIFTGTWRGSTRPIGGVWRIPLAAAVRARLSVTEREQARLRLLLDGADDRPRFARR